MTPDTFLFLAASFVFCGCMIGFGVALIVYGELISIGREVREFEANKEAWDEDV